MIMDDVVGNEELFKRDRVREILDRLIEVCSREFGVRLMASDIRGYLEIRKRELMAERIKDAMGHLNAEDVARGLWLYPDSRLDVLETLPDMKDCRRSDSREEKVVADAVKRRGNRRKTVVD